MSEFDNEKEVEDVKSIESAFEEHQETLEEAQKRKETETKRFEKVQYFTMDKDKTYVVRILPLPPQLTRRGYEFPLHEITLRINNPANGKVRNIMAVRATDCNISVDLIDTYRRMAVAACNGDENAEKVIKATSFSGGLAFDFKHAMYVYDLNSNDSDLLLWKASNGQFKRLEEAKESTWSNLIKKRKNSNVPCPISSWNAAYPVEIKKGKGEGGKTQYNFFVDLLSDPNRLTTDQLDKLMKATPIPDLVHRFTKFHLEAEIYFLNEFDKLHDFKIMESDEIKETIDKIKSELPPEDTSTFSLDMKKDEAEKGVTFDEISNKYDDFQSKGGKEKSEEGQEIRAAVIEYINRKNLDILVTRQKTICNLLDEIEDSLQDIGKEPEDTQAQPIKTNVKVKEYEEEQAEDEGSDDSEDEETASDTDSKTEGESDKEEVEKPLPESEQEEEVPTRRRNRTRRQ